MLRRFAPLIGLLFVALPLPSTLAQTLYKSVTPDGRVIYSDKPPPDAVKVEKPNIDTSKKGITPPSAREKAVLQQLQSDRQKREGDQERVRKAEIALHDAEVALSLGKEPQPGERLGTAGGNQRLTDGYWARIKKLEENVETARRNLERMRSGK